MMKKQTLKLLALILAFCMICPLAASCNFGGGGSSESQSEENGLATPKNLRIENGILRWNAVAKASEYMVSVDGDEFLASSNFFDLVSLRLPEGTYRVKVCAVGEDGETRSAFSSNLVYTVDGNGEIESVGGGSSVNVPFTNVEDMKFYTATPVSNMEGVSAKQLKNSFKDDTNWYFIYYLGQVKNVPMRQPGDTSAYYGGLGTQSLEGTVTKRTVESVTKSWERGLDKTDEWCNTFESRASDSLSCSVELEISAGVAFLDTSLGFGIEATSTLERGFSEMTGGSTTNSLLSCDSTTKEMELTQEEKWSFTASPDTAPAGYYLRMYTCSVDVYAVVVYNPANDAAIVTTVLEEAAYSGSVGFYYSEDNTFDFGNPDELTFDASKLAFEEPTKDYGGDPLPGTTTVTVDLTKYYAIGGEPIRLQEKGFALQDNGTNWYDAETGTLSIKGQYGNDKVTRVVIKGCYQSQNSQGDTCLNVIEGLTLQIDAEHGVEIVLENVAIRSASGRPVISLNAAKGTLQNDITVTLSSVGKNRIEGYQGSSAIELSSAQNVVLNISGAGTLDICGGKGHNGSNGGNAISVEKLNVSVIGTLNIYGGDGADGLSDGSKYANATHGGVAVVAKNVFVAQSGTVLIAGGNGGNCVDGANGADGTDGENGTAGWDSGRHGANGTDGADGKNGGNGGNGAVAISVSTKCELPANVTLRGGNAGEAGNGGNGGRGGNGGNGGIRNGDGVLILDTSRWKGLNGGNGGNGGDGGNRGKNGIAATASENVGTLCKNTAGAVSEKTPVAGQGGAAGSKGAKGYIHNHSWDHGTFYGSEGKAGSAGQNGV